MAPSVYQRSRSLSAFTEWTVFFWSSQLAPGYYEIHGPLDSALPEGYCAVACCTACSHNFEHYQSVIYRSLQITIDPLRRSFWVHVIRCPTTGIDIFGASLQNWRFAFVDMSWLLMTRNKARRTQQRTEQRRAQTASRSFILGALPSEHSRPTSRAA